ncbi:hypothetical protein VHEMI05498 [[Torrubiella] hemipterigena]|uniref:Acyl-CoA dehydrogenase n=1 Tax=[Torrubiella] hemipterigena TaxID=1531966 RepID=A0A0A1SY78_9HYPO|nr:hypothetical protein VHEMI05498 [[Torrubiella] hemipterigena]
MPTNPILSLTEEVTWSEPAWVNDTLASPYYNDSHRRLRENLRKFFDEHIQPHALDWEAKGEVPHEAAVKALQSGMLGLEVPEKYHPAGVPNLAGIPYDQWDQFHYLIAIDEGSRVEGGVLMNITGANAVGLPPVVNFGTEEQKDRWLPGIMTRETMFCLGITEPTGGSDVGGLRTTAEKTADGKHYIVNGVKKWISGSQWATHMTTAVRTGEEGFGGISILVVPLNLPGVTVTKIHNAGHNAGGASFVEMDDVKVPVENLIGEENEGVSIIMRNFNRERYMIAIQCNRKARTCLHMALQYALKRKTFGKNLMNSQVIRKKLADMAQRIEAHWAWIEQIAYHAQNSPDGWQSFDLASRSALIKVQGGQLLEFANREAIQIFGGAGYQKSGPGATVEQIARDIRVLVVGGGSEEVMNDLAVRQELLTLKSKI